MIEKKTFFRIFFNLGIFVSIFFTPWYVQVAIIILGIIIFKFFIESLFFALFLDTIFSVPIEMIYNFSYFYTAAFIIVFLFAEWIKKMIR